MTAPRYYVSVTDEGEPQLSLLSATERVNYPLPICPPGLVEQLNEWRRWREVLMQGLRISTEDAPELARVFADTLGFALTATDDGGQP